jgi:hypothetical protein
MFSLRIDDVGLRRQLEQLGGPRLRKVARRVVSSYTKPILARARAIVPVDSGRLRASLGRLTSGSVRSGSYTGRIGTRRDFSYTSKKTGGRMSSGRKLEAGHTLDAGSPNLYAGGIEFGTTKQGRIARKAGGAHFLNRSIDSQSQGIINGIASRFRSEINRV